jgi:hypothetical protein
MTSLGGYLQNLLKMFDQSYKTVATTSNINFKKVLGHLVDRHFIEKHFIDRHFIEKQFIDRNFSFRLPIINWNITFFLIFIDYRWQHRKGVAIYNARLSKFYNQNFGFVEQKMYFSTLHGGSSNLLLTLFCRENIFLVTFSELPSIGRCWYYTQRYALPIEHIINQK